MRHWRDSIYIIFFARVLRLLLPQWWKNGKRDIKENVKWKKNILDTWNILQFVIFRIFVYISIGSKISTCEKVKVKETSGDNH